MFNVFIPFLLSQDFCDCFQTLFHHLSCFLFLLLFPSINFSLIVLNRNVVSWALGGHYIYVHSAQIDKAESGKRKGNILCSQGLRASDLFNTDARQRRN